MTPELLHLRASLQAKGGFRVDWVNSLTPNMEFFTGEWSGAFLQLVVLNNLSLRVQDVEVGNSREEIVFDLKRAGILDTARHYAEELPQVQGWTLDTTGSGKFFKPAVQIYRAGGLGATYREVVAIWPKKYKVGDTIRV